MDVINVLFVSTDIHKVCPYSCNRPFGVVGMPPEVVGIFFMHVRLQKYIGDC